MNVESIINEKTKPDLTPMIDVVFLLLIFFMVTTTITKEEADLGIQLPTDTKGEPSEELPSRHIVDILPDGSVLFNGSPVASSSEAITLKGLILTLQRVKATADRMKVDTIIEVVADPISPHSKSVEVLDACAAAGIQLVLFGNF